MVSYSLERQHVFTFEDYLEIAERSPVRVELWEGVILDMSGGSPRHSAICANLIRSLGNQLHGKPCRAFDANLRVRAVQANRATYADVTLVCGALELDPADKSGHTVLNPIVLVEVLSPSTEGDDRGPKLDCYKTIASVRAVVLVAQDRAELTIHTRRTDGTWVQATHTDGTVRLADLDCELRVGELYEDLPAA